MVSGTLRFISANDSLVARPAVAAPLVGVRHMHRGAQIAVEGLHLREGEGIVERRQLRFSESSAR